MTGTTSLPVSAERRRGPNRAPGVRVALVIAGCALLNLPFDALGQVGFANAKAYQAHASSATFSYTVSAGSDRILIVGANVESSTRYTQSVTYNSIALTKVTSLLSGAGPNCETSLWYLVNPPVGTFNIVATTQATKDLSGIAMSFTGVHQTTPFRDTSQVGGTGNAASVGVTTVVGDLAADVVCQGDATLGTIAVGAGQTLRDSATASGVFRGAGSTEPGNGGTVTMSWSFTLSPTYAQIAVALRASSVTTYGVDVTPATTSTSRLPSNGTNYTVDFAVQNTGSATDNFDLLTTKLPGTAISVVSITGTGITQGGNPDSARLASLGAGASATATVTYSVGNVAAGSIDTMFFRARSVGSPTTSDTGRLVLTVIRPTLTTGKAVTPTGTQVPGTDLTYTITFTNAGSAVAVSAVIVDTLPGQVDFKVGSVVNNPPTGVSVAVEYSNNGGSTWTYVPASGACAAPAGYDRCVNRVRWRLLNDLSSTPPNNTGSFEFVARIR